MSHSPLIIDIAGTSLTDDDRRRLTDPLVGGIIYFSRNWDSRAQITALSAEIKSLRRDLLICVDHEGGRVQRFRSDGFTHLPAMRRLGERWMDDGGQARVGEGAQQALAAATACGHVLGAELRACGIDFSFTPVLDLDWGESGVIGDRAFHGDPRVVAALARALAHGLLQAGMQHCGKHFPGHGWVKADSHTDIPVDERPLDAILADDAAPYRWLSASLAAVMPAHVIYTQVDQRPAGFSRRWLQEVLRDRLGFGGAIISDDLSMEGARRLQDRTIDFTEAALAALEAGCDMALLCNQSLGEAAGLEELLDGMAAAHAAGRLPMHATHDIRRLALLPRSPAPPWNTLQDDPAYRRALALVDTLR